MRHAGLWRAQRSLCHHNPRENFKMTQQFLKTIIGTFALLTATMCLPSIVLADGAQCGNDDQPPCPVERVEITGCGAACVTTSSIDWGGLSEAERQRIMDELTRVIATPPCGAEFDRPKSGMVCQPTDTLVVDSPGLCLSYGPLCYNLFRGSVIMGLASYKFSGACMLGMGFVVKPTTAYIWNTAFASVGMAAGIAGWTSTAAACAAATHPLTSAVLAATAAYEVIQMCECSN